MTSAREYKEVVAGIAAVAEALRERDRAEASALARRLVGLDREMQRAGERYALTLLGVELHWEAALEALWMESWMKLRRRPGPDPDAARADVPALDAEVEQRSAELHQAVRRRWYDPRRG